MEKLGSRDGPRAPVQFRQEGPEFLDLAVLEQPRHPGTRADAVDGDGTDDHQPHAAFGTGPVKVLVAPVEFILIREMHPHGRHDHPVRDGQAADCDGFQQLDEFHFFLSMGRGKKDTFQIRSLFP
jgi:hypothetical protein